LVEPTLFDQSVLHTAIRQLEFALLLMIQQINELLGTIQSVLQGKLPINFINSATLQSILRNVSLHLPEGYELIAGTRMDNIHLYYELVTVTMVGNAHGLKLIMTIPLKTANQHFALYKIIVLPSRTFGNNFARYQIEFSYFGIDDSQRDYILFTETHRSRCTINSITLCPADVPIYSQQVVTCESSLFFQASTSNQLCRRNLLFGYRTPTMQPHGTEPYARLDILLSFYQTSFQVFSVVTYIFPRFSDPIR